ncbi:MAG: ATP-binding protein [Arthrobacter sp.]
MASAVGSRALLLQLTTNLLHNAIIHNLPEDGMVWARTEADPGSVELIVENTGEKLAPELIATFTEPFQRGTERVPSDQAGVGLGLTIVRSIVQAHDGTLSITGRPDGGLRISAKLPSGTVS